jgi:uncharacterized delta-60 repeat protein
MALLASFSFDASAQSIDASFNPTDVGFNFGDGFNGIVQAIAVQSNGKILIGGQFSTYNGIGRNNIARLNADGTLDASFNPGTGANGSVYTLVVQSDGRILIGGEFGSYNGTYYNNVARLNADGSLDPSFNPAPGAAGAVRTLAIQSDGKIVIGGEFTSYNGTARNRIARLNADGSLDLSFNPGTGANSIIYTLAVQSDGKIMIGGYFTTYNGTARNRIVRLNVDGSLDTGFNPGTGATGPNVFINALTIQSDGKVVIGGEFTSYNGTARNRIARLNAGGSLDTGFNPGTGANSSIHTLALQSDGKILLGGDFVSYNSTGRNRVARINNTSSISAPTVTLGTLPAICQGATSFEIPYTATTNNPDRYTVTGTGVSANQTGSLMGTSGTFTVSIEPANFTGSFSLVVTNISTGTSSDPIAGTVTVSPASVGGTATATEAAVCSGTGTTISLSGQSGSIQWQSSTDNSSWSDIPEATGTSLNTGPLSQTVYYRAKLTSGSCAAAYSTVATVTQTTAPTISITPEGPGIDCKHPEVPLSVTSYGYSSKISNSIFSGPAVGYQTFSDYSAFTSVSAAGLYSVTVTWANGCTGSATHEVQEFRAFPEFQFTKSGDLGCGNTSVKLNVEFPESDATYDFSGPGLPELYNRNIGSIDVNQPGTYSVLVTNSRGCQNTAEILVESGPSAFTVTGGGNFCVGGSGVEVGLDGSQTGVTYRLYRDGGAIGTAMEGTGSAFSFGTFTLPGNYTVQATSGTCVQAMTGAVSVEQSTPPGLSLMQHGELGCNIYSVGIEAVSTFQTKIVNYQFSGPQVDHHNFGYDNYSALAGVSKAGTYSVSVTWANGCIGTASIEVLDRKDLPVITLTKSGDLGCGNTSVTLSVVHDPNELLTTYMFAGPGVGLYDNRSGSIVVDQPGSYSVTVTNYYGCDNKADIVVESGPAAFTVTGGGSFCADGPGVSVGLDGSQTGVTYQLYRDGQAVGTAMEGTGNNLDFGKVKETGVYSVKASAGSCLLIMTGEASVQQTTAPTLDFFSTGDITCNSINAELKVYPASSSEVTNYAFAGPFVAYSGIENTSAFASVAAAGTYTVTVTWANGCIRTASVEILDRTALPELILTKSGDLSNASPTVTLTATLDYSYTYEFNGPGIVSKENNTATVDQPGIYQVTVINLFGCRNVAEVEIKNRPIPTITLGTVPAICQGATSFEIPYTATTNSLDQYTVTGTGISANQTGSLTGTSGTITVSIDPATFTGNFTLVVTNNAEAISSAPIEGLVTITPATTYYADADGDGWGNEAVTIQACEVRSGYVEKAGDCNDGDNTMYPSAPELCDGKDNNCNGEVDEGVQQTFYADADGDGFGNATTTVLACSAPTGYVAQAGDCNDGDNTIYPGAPELCDGKDNNCNGQTDEGQGISFTTQPPAYATACVGTSITVSIVVVGTNLQYQWLKDGKKLNGQTTATLTLSGIQSKDAGTYACAVTSPCGSVTSTDYILSVSPVTAITTQPMASLLACPGSIATASVTAVGGNLKYQWYWGESSAGSPVAGQTSATLSLTNVQPSQTGKYYCVITGDCGTATSTPFELSLKQPTVITTQPPATLARTPGSSATLTVVASGTNLKYQWYLDGKKIGGQTSPTLLLDKLKEKDSGTYRCEVSGDCGIITSTACILTVSTASGARLAASVDGELLPLVVEVFPNPTVTSTVKVLIQGAAQKQVQLQVLDQSGRILVEQELKIQNQQHTEQLDLTHAPAGLLLLRVNTTEQSQVRKLIKQ